MRTNWLVQDKPLPVRGLILSKQHGMLNSAVLPGKDRASRRAMGRRSLREVDPQIDLRRDPVLFSTSFRPWPNFDASLLLGTDG